MYLHLGNDVVISTKDIVGIFDLENTSISKFTRKYLATVQKKGYVVNVTDELPKSYVICDNGEDIKVYISQISSKTLMKRTRFFKFIG